MNTGHHICLGILFELDGNDNLDEFVKANYAHESLMQSGQHTIWTIGENGYQPRLPKVLPFSSY